MPRDAQFKQHLCADIDGFSLHAAVRCGADDHQALEQLCRYITRPALADERVQTNTAGQVVLKLKTAWRDGTTHLVMSPLEFMQRLAALVPRPRLHLIRFHGVLAPNAKLRALVVPQVVPQEPEASAHEAKPARSKARRVRSGLCAPPTGAPELGEVAQAGVRSRPGALPELRWRTEDHCGDPGTASDRENPHALGAAGAGTPSRGSPWPAASSGLTLPNCDTSSDPATRAAGVGCVRAFTGPMAAGW